ncbi:MAG TPA: type II toxin-antitoxin system VapC family toxin [Solirubrobacteraceae bacterium]|nr:type II toxin-antitoxin system VapC family toxin [Solirubrobacteraceae bacterium]
MTAYLDASAAVKLVRAEGESGALRDEVVQWDQHASSEVLAVELRRTARRGGDPAGVALVEDVLAAIAPVPWSRTTADRAGTVPFTPPLRSLDAIHLATALTLRDDLDVFIADDRGLLAAAVAEGLATASPGQA